MSIDYEAYQTPESAIKLQDELKKKGKKFEEFKLPESGFVDFVQENQMMLKVMRFFIRYTGYSIINEDVPIDRNVKPGPNTAFSKNFVLSKDPAMLEIIEASKKPADARNRWRKLLEGVDNTYREELLNNKIRKNQIHNLRGFVTLFSLELEKSRNKNENLTLSQRQKNALEALKSAVNDPRLNSDAFFNENSWEELVELVTGIDTLLREFLQAFCK